MTEWNFFCKRHCQGIALAVLSLVAMCSGPLLALDFDALEGADGAKLVPLTHVTPEQGQRLLARLKLATASPLPGMKALLITAKPDDLRKAVAFLDVVDSPEQYDIKQLGVASGAILPTNEEIEAAVGNISIGTFMNPPRTGKPRALIDVHGGMIVAVAPIFQLQDIALAVELGPDVLKRRRGDRPAAPTAPTVQARAMLESDFSAQVAYVPRGPEASHTGQRRQEVQKRVEEIRPRTAQNQGLFAEMPRPEMAAPRSFGAAGEPLAEENTMPADDVRTSTPVGLEEQHAESTDVAEPNILEPVVEESGGLEPGQIVPTQTNELTPNRATTVGDVNRPMPAGARVQAVPDVGSYEPAGLFNGDRIVDMELPDALPVVDLLDLVGKYTNLTYLYDPSQVSGNVTLKLNGTLRGQMKVRDLYLLLESVLKFRDLAMTRHKDNVVTIVPVSDALKIDPQLVGPGEPDLRAGDVVVTRVFDLRYIDAESAKNLLDGMQLSVDVTPITERSTLIVTAYAYRMARIEQLLQMVDKPGDPRKFKYRQLKYTMARSLAEKVKALAEQLESVSVTVGAPEPETSTPARLPGETTAAYTARVNRLRALAASRARTGAAAASAEAPTKPAVYLDADERTNRILMIGLEEQLEVVDDLIDALDVEQQDLRTLRLYRLEFVDAEEASNKLVELGIITRAPETTRSSSRITRTGTPSAANPAAAAAAARAATAAAMTTPETEVTEEGPVEQPQVVVIESTNSLLVNATAEQHAQIQTIIGYVDSEMLATEIPYKIYPLENSSPEGLAEVLESLIQETTQNQDPEGKIQTTVISRREEIRIVPDPNTYSLIVYASKKNQEWISNLVQQLDKRRPQVLIDVTLVEITKTDQFNYDLNIVQSLPNLVNTSGLTGTLISGSETVAPITSSDIVSKLLDSDRSQYADFQSNSGSFRGFYGDKHINALLDAVQSKNYGRVLAKPKILVNDNQPGTIKTTDTTYVEKTSSIPISTAGAGTNADLITTATDYTPYEAGLELNITPHISEGDLLRLDVSLIRSDFRPTEDAKKPPDTTASEISTAVTVPDGSTIILGGLIRLNQNKGGKKVPILGDLPLLGGLFRSASNSDNQSKLYVFVKAEVIRPDQSLAHGRDELERLSERNRLAFEQHESQFQTYQSWPGIKPAPVDPPKVLDAQ